MKIRIKNLIIFICLATAIFAVAHFALALDVGLNQAAGTGLPVADPRIIAANIIRIALGFLGIIAVSLIIYAGWLWMTAAGEEEKVEKAKKILISAVIGLAICLASFAIASFILSRLTEATTGGGDGTVCDPPCGSGQYCCSSSCSSAPCGTAGGGSGYAFAIASTRPNNQAAGVVRNVVVKVFFNNALGSQVNQTALDNNLKVEKIATIDPATGAETALNPAQLITGTREIIDSRLVISFTDNDSCNDVKGTLNCLPEWSKFKVTVNGYSGLVSVNNQSLSCSAGSLCEFVFSTGSLLDTNPPTASLVPTQICKDDGSLKPDANTVTGWGKDDVGISALKFTQKKIGATTDQQVYLAPGSMQTYQTANYKYDTANLAVGDNYVFSLYAYDLANHAASSNFTATIKPGHCCNGLKDASETDVDCGGDCLACVGGACNKAEPNQCSVNSSNCDNNLCSTFFCDCQSAQGCRCATKPIIFNVTPLGGFCSNDKNKFCQTDADCGAGLPVQAGATCNVDTPNGAAGNFVTLSGRYFGDTAGKVYFNDNKQAGLASGVNANCVSSWQDNQIIAVMPNGAIDGPVKVADSNNNFDITNDERGPLLKDFSANNLKRPGLCLANPDSGFYNDQFNLQGNAFNQSSSAVLFGNSASAVAATAKNWTDKAVDATVPNIKAGLNSVFVKAGNVSSNNLLFTVKDDSFRNPAIEYIEPAQGPSGQYITIYGHNFKNFQLGKSLVKFYLPADPTNLILADTDFPDACKNNWWHDTYIIVKVPKVDANKLGAYKVVVTNNESKTSLPADFTINDQTVNPGMCSLDPNNGPVGQPVSAYGERFGSSLGSIKYFNNKDGGRRSWTEQKVDSNVPNGAATGPVKIINNAGSISNSLPFRVGKCASNTDCDSGEECCGSGTDWSGVCRAQGSCLTASAVGCGFGWTFKTSKKQVGDPCYSGAAAGSCDASKSNCGTGLVCDTTSCVCKKPCNSNTADNSQCVADNNKCGAYTTTPNCNKTTCLCECATNEDCSKGQTCDPNTKTCTNNIVYSCAGYGDQCSTSYFCPNSPGKCSSNAGGLVSTGVKCNDEACKELGRCLDLDKNNLCSYSVALKKCKKNSSSCDLNKAAAVSGVSDINGNKVELKCGSVDNKNVWYYESNQTCVNGYSKSVDGNKCLGQACIICDSGFSCAAENGQAVCAVDKEICPTGSDCQNGDCVKTKPSVCECCCDKTQNTASGNPGCCSGLSCGDTCGAGGNFGLCTGCTVKNAAGAIDQTASNGKCSCSGTSGKFCDTSGAGGLGACLDCTSLNTTDGATADCNQRGAGSCCVDAKNKNFCRGGAVTVTSGTAGDNNNYCAYYKCSGNTCDANPVYNSALPTYSTIAECNTQCAATASPGKECKNQAISAKICDVSICQSQEYGCLNDDGSGSKAPDACGTCCCNPANDKCAAPLTCYANKGTCTGAGRGLCCGCSQDSQCGSGNGCGTDTCCQARPEVISTSLLPANGATGVCRNSLIQATFDSVMQVSSFSGNVIVAGDYKLEQCPAGTKYLTQEYKPNWLAKIKFWLVKWPVINKLFANEAQAIAGNFCIVPGTVNGSLTDGGKKTVLEFRSQQVLEANRKYYVIIKGDSDITDAINNGVLSENGIGMSHASDESGTQTFNGVTYQGKIWSFTTKPSSDSDSGVCRVNAVSISPSSYLFNTVINDPADDNDKSKDQTIKDSDKIFTAQAWSAEKQPIIPIENLYNWKWDWTIDDQAIVKFKNGDKALDNNPEQTIVAQNNKEANTLAHAKATITQDQVNKTTTVDQKVEGLADVYVFICANPWPPFKTDSSGNLIWEPWRDASGNCTIGNSSCANTNYELYYCRDAGGVGTADDLPAILSDNAVIRPYSAEQNILKEFYFFREGLPSASGSFTVSALPQGGGVLVSWNAVVGAAGYKVYYGTASGNYTNSIDAGAATNKEITGLTNGQKYYFALTSYNAKKAESDYSEPVSATPKDTTGPNPPPSSLTATPKNKQVELAWTETDSTAVSFRVFYKAADDCNNNVNFGSSIPATNNTATVNNLANGIKYCFGVVAYDSSGNKSATTTASAIPLAP